MRVWMRVLPLAVVAAVFCAPLFAGLGRADQENDEAIYSYAVESILETGDWLNPRSSPSPDVVFLEKPPLKFWIVALPIRLGLLPNTDFGLRFWDAVFGSLAFLYVFSIGRRMAGWFCGVAALLLLYSFDSLVFAHGLRGNNMEAALVLCYTGGVYHFLRWVEERGARVSRRHALAVGLYFLLGFMTKFVAALFLPAVLGMAALELKAVRDKALREWRVWGLVAVVVFVLAAPWFVYQLRQPDRELWQTMLGEHVYQRFNAWLDPSHLKPRSYYFTDAFRQMMTARTLWVVLAGALLVHVRVVRERWPEGTIALYWFWLPFVLMSIGSSKLRHYTYPFLPPVALAGGYFMASVVSVVDAIAAGQPPAWMARIARTFGIGGVVARRRPDIARWMARAASTLALLAFLPVASYRSALTRATTGDHPLRTSRDCIRSVFDEQRAAGRGSHPMYVCLPKGFYQHPFFLYYRHLGWDSHDDLLEGDLTRMLDTPGQQRPIVMPGEQFRAFHAAHDGPGVLRPLVRVHNVVVLMPGPYAKCGT